jgi:uncharacterized membrane protein
MAKENSVVVSTEKLYKKLPDLPKGVKEFAVAVAPWLAIVFGILGILGSLAAFGISTVASPFVALGGGLGLATNLIIATLLGLVESILMVIAFPSLLKRRYFGWTMLFWSEVLAIVAGVILLSVYSVIVGLIWLYFVFQIKSYYK